MGSYATVQSACKIRMTETYKYVYFKNSIDSDVERKGFVKHGNADAFVSCYFKQRHLLAYWKSPLQTCKQTYYYQTVSNCDVFFVDLSF